MCGIIAHIGSCESVDIVLKALKKLEYRGYDSAGVSFIDEENRPQLFKKKGKIENLLEFLGKKKWSSNCAIGHTRWATHGQVSDRNAHPHVKESVSLVHNGIIENVDDLRKELLAQGVTFVSETDSEVFLALICLRLEQGMDFRQAFLKSFERIRGNSAFVVMHSEQHEILAMKRGAPLVCGSDSSGLQGLISSDPYALVGTADKLYFPEDNVLCSLSKKNTNIMNFFDHLGRPTKRYVVREQGLTNTFAEKGKFEHFMLKEICEQPGLIRDLIQFYFSGDGQKTLNEVTKYRPERIYISACGTAAYAGNLIRDFFERENRIPTTVELGSEFRYRKPIFFPGTLGLFISQSGETADTLAAQELCSRNNIMTLGLVNVEGSTLYRESDHNLLIKAGVEISVASTKAFTQMVLTGRLLAFMWTKNHGSEEERKKIIDRYDLLARRIDDLIASSDSIKEMAIEIYNKKGYFYTGRGIYYPVALEGALKLKEIAYVHAEGCASGELKHGPLALIDEEMVNIAIVGSDLRDKTVANVQEVKARNGIVVGIGPHEDKGFKEICDYFIPMNYEGLDELSPVYANVANQLLAYYMAKFKGTDIDKPRNLAKSVTVE